MVVPLRKRTAAGILYTRFPDIETALGELYELADDELIRRCHLSMGHQQHVPTECLLHFVRRSSSADNQVLFETLFKMLAERIRRSLPRAESADGKTVSLVKTQVYEQVYDRFITLLAKERSGYVERLDFFEIQFIGGLAKLKISAQDKAWKEENRGAELEADDESGQIDPEVEIAAGSYDPFDPAVLDDKLYRSRLGPAMDRLSALQKRILEMLRLGLPIDSKDPAAVTISRSLGRSEKTIRTHRDKAYARLRIALTRGVD